MKMGYPPPQPTRESGEPLELPQRGPGRSDKRILVHVDLKKPIW